MSAQKHLFETPPEDMARHGAVWWRGNWQCRNFHGYFQSREGGAGVWCFQIYAFGDTDCCVYALNALGEMVQKRAPLDDQNRITICVRKYGRRQWAH